MYSTTYNKEEKLWYGSKIPPLYNPKINLAQALLSSMIKFDSKTAQTCDDNGIEMSFNEMRTKTIRAAQNLEAIGYKPKEVFGFMVRNSLNVAPALIASIAIGCPVNALDPSFGKTEVIQMLNIAKPVLIFCDVEFYELLSKCLEELQMEAKIFTFGGSMGQSEPVENLFKETCKEHQFVPVEVDGSNDASAILLTSGTTGPPKGVSLSHAALLHQIAENGSYCSNDVFLCFSSLYWISGLGILLSGALFGFNRIITKSNYSPELQLHLIQKYKVTRLMSATYQLVLMIKSEQFFKSDISSLKYAYVAGSKIPCNLKCALRKLIPNMQVIITYGLSEIAGSVACDYSVSDSSDIVGQLIEGTCIKIIDDDGNRCDVNVDGEICIKPTYRCLGYYENQKATDKLCDKEGFVLSGDVGHFDEDGNLYFVDRKKDLIKYRSYQVSPSAIEAYLMESPNIRMACVVGITDSMGNDLPSAVTVRAEESNISEKDVFDMVAGHFADYCKLRGGVYFVDTLPRTPSGKVLRREVKKMATELYNSQKAQ